MSAELLRLAAGQDPEAFEEIYRRYNRMVRRYAYYLVGDDADDVVEEVFLKLWTGAFGLPDEIDGRAPGLVRFWAVTVATYHARTRQRVSGRETELLDDVLRMVPDSGETPPDLHVFRGEIRAAIVAAYLTLPPRMRLVARLRFLREETIPDIADLLGVTTGAVAAMLASAKTRLQEALVRVYTPTGCREHWVPNRRGAR